MLPEPNPISIWYEHVSICAAEIDDDIQLQWINPVKLSVSGPDALVPGLSGGLEIEGTLYNEATFIS